ncbi:MULTISPECIES: response regulator [Paenibacillus]|uniref:CheY-like chemotaxis protein n=1 Tax=Paenibacillus pabuli TaxID=1472 RepID=A0A855XVP7_9BACL|nr:MULTISPECIES: response regulator [Paenibacillus]PWW39681.1 CheY-like chemotaxis protein [Paenibacillus pabuli]PXW06853.1 CheY-like chemotaxis protein [Paenibacillus taichungensis]RAJ01168.1 CheY-like chemotaxis protein [Paenibacillus pabuli]
MSNEHGEMNSSRRMIEPLSNQMIRGGKENQEEQVPTSFPTSILLADDNVINRQVVLMQLKKLGMTEVDAVSNGEEASEAFLSQKYSMILMDNMMPVMDGLEATRHIRAIERNKMWHPIPIIAMTGNVMDGEKEKCFEAGMNDFMGKPFTLEALKNMIQKWHSPSGSGEIAKR